MLLKRLKEYADERMDLPPTLCDEVPVRYIIELDSSGKLLSRSPMDTADPTNPRTRRGQRRLAPQVQRSAGIKPLLLADKAEYTLGLARVTSKPERVALCHGAFLDIVDRCAAETEEQLVIGVQKFLYNSPVSQLDLPDDFDRSATITFRVNGKFPIDQLPVQEFWATEHDPSRARDVPIMHCLVCGEHKPVLSRLQAKIKGVPGGHTTGTSIISANADAFESYGLKASLIAPTCADCGEKFTKAANHLLAGERSRIIFPDTAFIFWTRDEVEVPFWELLSKPTAEDVQILIETTRPGKRVPGVDDIAFYGAVLSNSGSRVAVRDWIETTVGQVKIQLTDWFRRQSIVGTSGENAQPFGLHPLAFATVRESADLAPPGPRAILRSALTGTPLPWNLLYQAVHRNRTEHGVTGPRAALIKLVMATQHRDGKEDFMVQLDQHSSDPAYRCGRLLCVLEEAYRLAMPGAKTTIVDRFYSIASSAPASVFSRLLSGARSHMSKLQRDRPGAHYAIQQRVEEILAGLSTFPKMLTIEQQALFSLGYYHQRAHDRAQAREAFERRRRNQENQEQNITT